jgi:hypothetical protein
MDKSVALGASPLTPLPQLILAISDETVIRAGAADRSANSDGE